MLKYLIWYFALLAPAALANIFLDIGSPASYLLRWAFLWIFAWGWAIVTGVGAAYRPISAMIIPMLYASFSTIMLVFGFNVTILPLGILASLIGEFSAFSEYYAVLALLLLCAVGYTVGLLHRRNNPNPYRPRILPYK